jgi:hypothetical protein
MMNAKTEGALSMLAALLVLFTTMLDPRVAASLAIVCLVSYGIDKFMPSRPKANNYHETNLATF